jgi:hypothetical protein
MTELKYSKEKPKIYDKLHEVFGVNFDDGVIICDGWTIHCKYEVPPAKVVHEVCHARQQDKYGRNLFWEKYLTEPSFRLEMEVEAYRKEYQFICENIKDRNLRFEFLYEMARVLSSPQYGRLCSGDEAIALIQNG